MKTSKAALGILGMVTLLGAGTAHAEVDWDQVGDRIDHRLDVRGERINDRLDHRGGRINDRLDLRGERTNNRLDRWSDRAAEQGKYKLSRHLDNKGNRIEHRKLNRVIRKY